MTRSVLWGWWEFDDDGGDGRKFCVVVVYVVRIDEDRKCYVVCYCSVFGERKREVDGVKEEDVVVWVVNVYGLMTMCLKGGNWVEGDEIPMKDECFFSFLHVGE